jgi:G3E family GTPase
MTAALETRMIEDSQPGVRSASTARIPVVLVTGFLGSGKTTLVNRLLKTDVLRHAAVVVSEYGDVGIDNLLIEAPRQRLRVVDGGCLCGHVHEEIAASLLHLLRHRHRQGDDGFEQVVIETSGLADPVPIVQMLLTDPAIAAAFELQRVVTVVDGELGLDQLAEHDQANKQAAVADLIVISKVDMADPGRVAALSARLGAINAGAPQVQCAHGDLDPDRLAGIRYDAAAIGEEARGWLADSQYPQRFAAASPAGGIDSFSLVHDDEITIPGLVLWLNLLAGFRGGGLLRVKGVVNVEGKPYAIQAVQTVISEPVPLAEWRDADDRRSRLVFITRGMDTAEIRATFAAFSFEGGRDARNLTIRPDTYARFKDTIELFRTANRRAPVRVSQRTAI